MSEKSKKMEIDYNEPLLTAKMGGHKFRFFLNENNGEVEFTVDGENLRYKTKELRNNIIYFRETLELFVGEQIEFFDKIKVDEMDFTNLKAQQNTLLAHIKAQKDRLKDWSLDKKSKKELLSMIDKHSKKIKFRRLYEEVNNGKKKKMKYTKKKEKYAVHTFKIGSETYRMIERYIEGKQIINPDYRIRRDFPRIGGIGEKEGELMVWKYYYEKDEPSVVNPEKKQGFWETGREMRYSEQICHEIIKRYGVFANKEHEKSKREKISEFFKKFFGKFKKKGEAEDAVLTTDDNTTTEETTVAESNVKAKKTKKQKAEKPKKEKKQITLFKKNKKSEPVKEINNVDVTSLLENMTVEELNALIKDKEKKENEKAV